MTVEDARRYCRTAGCGDCRDVDPAFANQNPMQYLCPFDVETVIYVIAEWSDPNAEGTDALTILGLADGRVAVLVESTDYTGHG